jgi:hypothetical protein
MALILLECAWGTHFSQFYQTKEELVEVLIPWFEAKLKNNEYF